MDSLVSTEWLAAHLDDPALLILDATAHLPAAGRNAQSEFVAGHIPGACHLDLATFKDATSPVPNALPTGEQVSSRLASLGWTPQRQIVHYDDSAVKTSARAWFALRRAGVDAALLDGGLAKWKAEALPLETGASESVHADQSRLDVDMSRDRSKAQMFANIAAAREQVIDARDADRFTGATVDTVHDLPGGHIPGARNLHFRDLYRPDGTFRPMQELRTAFERARIDLSRPIVASCGSGVTASVLIFALHLLGVGHAALYDGSWAEWGADAAMPRETGYGPP